MSTMIPGETVTLIVTGPATGRDSDHNPTYTPTSTPCDGAIFTPAGSTEVVQGVDTVTQTAKLTWIAVVPDLTAVDRIRRANGDLYEVTGNPSDFNTPGFTRVLEVNVKRASG